MQNRLSLSSIAPVAFGLLLIGFASCSTTRAELRAGNLDRAPALQPEERTAVDDLETVGRQDDNYLPPYELPEFNHERWKSGTSALQGYFGAVLLETVERDGGSLPPVDGSDEDLSRMPVIGGGGQWKLAGKKIDFGFEGLLSFAGIANAEAFRIGGGGAVVIVDVDLFLFDLYGGPFVSVFLGDRLRVYGGAGPLLQWAWYEEDDDINTEDGTGFGTGYYARVGAELQVRPGLLVGVGVRYSESTIDLGNDLGDLDVEGFQYVITVTTGL